LVRKETPPLAFRVTEGWWQAEVVVGDKAVATDVLEHIGNGLCKDSVSLIIK
jgi:hypothetical protein